MNKIEWIENDFHIRYKNNVTYPEKAVIIIPLVNEIPSEQEILNLTRLLYRYKSLYIIVFIAGEEFNLSYYQTHINYPFFNVLRVNNDFMSRDGLHQLFARNEFYSLFKDYEFIVNIYPNVFVFNVNDSYYNYLDIFLKDDIDYIASKLKMNETFITYIDNGAAIRRTESFLELTKENDILDFNELVFRNFNNLRITDTVGDYVFCIEDLQHSKQDLTNIFSVVI